MKRRLALAGVLAACLAALLSPALSEAAPPPAPAWKLTVTPNADWFQAGRYGVYKVEAENVGNAPTSNASPIEIENLPPPGLVGKQVYFVDSGIQSSASSFEPFGGFGEPNPSPNDACLSATLCMWPEGASKATMPAIQPGQRLIMVTIFEVSQGLSGALEDVARISGGGVAAPVEASATNGVSPDPPFGSLHLDSALTEPSGNPYTHLQAGSHPYSFTTEFTFGTVSIVKPISSSGEGQGVYAFYGAGALHEPKEIVTELPPGLLANPQAIPPCSLADFFAAQCQPKAIVGTLGLRHFNHTESALRILSALYNLQPTGAYPGELGALVGGIPFVLITTGVRTASDYGVTATAVAEEAGLNRARATLWGVPAEPSHDAIRGRQCEFLGQTELFVEEVAPLEAKCESEQSKGPPRPAGAPETPFLIMPSECSAAELPLRGSYDAWDLPGEFARQTTFLPPVEGCNQLHFEPKIEARPTTGLADSPSGLHFNLHVPQNEAPEADSTPSLREAVVKLPAGLTVNPSSGNGLAGCSPSQIGLETPVGVIPAHFSEAPAQCPDASKIGLAEVKTPLLHEPLGAIPPTPGRFGAVYLSTPHQNPFGSLLAAYIVLEGEGLIIKLPGKIEADPETGQLTGRFTEDPQTPFEDFNLEFFGGARGDLRTPSVCGEYTTTATLTPYSAPESGPPAERSSSFETVEAAHEGEECPGEASQQPNAPVFRAGTESPQAAAYSPFSFRLARADGSQEIGKIETTLPPGLTGKLAGVGECSEAQLAVAQGREHEGGGEEEKASPSCPSSSEVGTVEVAAGAGPTPLYVQGKAYLAGPYKGAPLSLAIITPAVAGPFDLGDVLVRTALYVEPETAQIKAVSDPIPHILDGIPLDVRSITLKMDRPNFTLNPTDCEPLAFSGSETSVLESTASLSQRFQVGGCAVLPFKPKLSISLKGSTKRTGHPALKAVLTMKPGQANIAKAQVTLPHSEFLDQGHIGTICTRVQFAEGNVPGEKCPAGSVYGFARAITPLLDHPLEGPVYLMGGFGHKLPDLAAALNGQIDVLLHGKVDTGKSGGIRNTFEVVPDAPVSKFMLQMKGGAKGLLVNSESLCGKKQHRAEADFTAQNGKVSDTEPVVRARCPKPRRGHGHHRRHG